jgi:hypothetical protein
VVDAAEENEIRMAWGEYVVKNGWPHFRGEYCRIPKRPRFPVTFDECMASPAPTDYTVYDFRFERREIMESAGRGRNYVIGYETTVTCKDVIVHRSWTRA